MTHSLTVLVPCKNERLNIRPCIESIRDIADEVLVADSGSTDGTLEIVSSMGGCRVIQRDYGNSGDFKNWAIPQAAHDWVLILDADERVSPALRSEIRELLSGNPRADGYWLYRANHFMGHRVRYGPWGNDRVLRLFRKSVAQYVGDTDHAEIEVSTGRVGRLRNRLTHYTFWSYDQYFCKIHRYSQYQSRLWHTKGRPASCAKLALAAPFRFLHTYIVRLGFLDGGVGIQVCMLVAFQSFLKQARLWEIWFAQDQPDPEAENGEEVRQQAA